MTFPLGKEFSLLTKYYIGIVSQKLSFLEIERYYYPLVVISESQNAMCQKDIAECIAADNVSMVRIVDYLAEKGFINRVKNKEDRRAYHIVLTEKGKKAVPKIKAAFDEANEICFNGFNEEEKRDFTRMLLMMHGNLSNHPRMEVKLNYKKIK